MRPKTNRLARRCILVTGPDGFMGKHLVRYLRGKNFRVIPWRKDVRKPICFSGRVDAVIHLAGTTRTSQFRRNARAARDANMLGARNALELCRTKNAMLVFPSTAGIYGDRAGAAAEHHRPAPVTPYAKSKLRAEQLCRIYARKHGVRTVILRIFNVFGPGQNKEFLISHLAHCVTHERPIALKHPEARRDFIHVADVVSAFHRALFSPAECLAIYNIGSGKDIAVEEVMKTMGQMVNRPVRWKQKPVAGPEIRSSRADIRKAKRDLRWSPRIALKRGLRTVLSTTF